MSYFINLASVCICPSVHTISVRAHQAAQHICPSPGCVMTSDSSPALPAPPLHCFLFSLFSEDDLLWPCLSPGTHSLSPIDVCYTMPAPALVTLPYPSATLLRLSRTITDRGSRLSAPTVVSGLSGR